MQPPIKARFAIVVVDNDAGEILLLKRAADRALGAGRWGFPAGHIEAGESPLACAWRELREELGAEARLAPVRALGPIRDSLYGRVYEVYLFHMRWLGGGIVLNPEHSACAWVGRARYHDYPVMDGVDEDLYLLGLWPREALNQDVLDRALAIRRAAGETWP